MQHDRHAFIVYREQPPVKEGVDVCAQKQAVGDMIRLWTEVRADMRRLERANGYLAASCSATPA
jgi:hypothetical protein